jgi:hypothetical protein
MNIDDLMELTKDRTKDDLLLHYTSHMVDKMPMDELREALAEFIYDDMHPLPKSEILEYIDAICPEILGKQEE